MKKLLFIGAAIAVTGAGCFSSPPTPRPTPAAQPPVASAPTPPANVPPPTPVQRITVDSTEKSIASILPQTAGNEVSVAYVRLEKQGFVTVHADDKGKPGKLLGQSAILFAGENTTVPIRASTVANTAYWIELRLDNGDGKFTDAKDLIAKDSKGGPVQFQFMTLLK